MKTYRQLQLKHYTVAPCIESQNCYSRKLHLLSFAYCAQRSEPKRTKWSPFGWVQMQWLFSNTFPVQSETCPILCDSKDLVESQRFWPIMISSFRFEISANLDWDTWVEVSRKMSNSNMFSIAWYKEGILNESTATRCSSFWLIRSTQGSE